MFQIDHTEGEDAIVFSGFTNLSIICADILKSQLCISLSDYFLIVWDRLGVKMDLNSLCIGYNQDAIQ